MKRSTILGCFVGLLSLTLSAQTTQPSSSKTSSSPTGIEVQKKSTASIQELLTRYNNVGKQAGSVLDHFSSEEQQMLRSYFSSNQPARDAKTANYVSLNNSEEARDLFATEAQKAAYKGHTPLFVAPVLKNSSVEAKDISMSPQNRASQNRQYTPLFVDYTIQGRETGVQLPAAYFNNTAAIAGETIAGTRNGQRNTNVTIPFTGTYYNNRAPNAILYDNGPFWNVAGTPNVSLLQTTTLGMGTLGAGAQFSAGNSVADDVVFTEDVDITSIDVFAYQTGTAPPSITGVYLQVWDGDPSGGGANVIWGNLTTPLTTTATYADANRATETTPADTARKIQRANALTPGLSLSAGTYWIQYTLAGSGASGPWTPPIAILGQSTTGNALQYQTSTSVWVALVDVGPQGLPFVIYGETGGGSSAYCIPEGTNSSRFIDNFSTTGGDDNISNMGSGFSPLGYGDFYGTHTVSQERDGTVDFSVDIEGGTAGFRVWVDWNQDGVFDIVEEVAYVSSSYQNSQTGTITVPTDALEGDTRMRIVSHWLSTSGDVDPCKTGFTYGEFEDYKFTVTAGGGSIVYCIPEGTNSSRFIDNFSTTGGDDNISNMGSGFSPLGYGDFYNTDTVSQEQEGTVNFTVDIQGGTAGFRAWVDWNQDGVFDIVEEVAYASSSYQNSQTGTITVPADALEGDTRMRIVSHWLSTTGDVDPCKTGFTYGEFEDYKFTVTAGGGGGTTACNQSHATSSSTGGSGSSVDSDYKTASDIVVAAGIDFTIDTIEVPFLTFAPNDPPTTANVVYYKDSAGLPGVMIGSETVVPTIISAGPWVNPVADIYETSLAVTPFTFEGDASSDTTYWIEISMGTATNQGTVFWVYTLDTPVEGSPKVQFDATVGTWSVQDPTHEVVYNYSGVCEPMGGGTTACAQDHSTSSSTGGSGSSVDSDYKTASDIVVAAGIDFTIDTIEVPFLTFAPNDPPTTANVVYYKDSSGLPGVMIGSETVVPTIISAGPWVNPVADIYETSLAVTPFTFEGDASSDTTYWIEVSMGTATNQGTVFWLYTLDTPVEGNPKVQFDATAGTWSVQDPTHEVVYNYSGVCEPMGGGGCTPGSLQTLYASGNNGSPGGAVYFDLTVDSVDIDVLSFDLNTADLGAFTVGVYMFEGTYAGNEANPAMWGAAEATGSGTGAGEGLPSTATLDAPISLSANTTYAVALVFDATHSHYYTNGDGTNQNYSNGDLELNLGSASNTPFTTPIFAPRIFNGGVGYCVGGGGVDPGPLSTVYGINNGNLELIGFGVATPGNTEVLGSSPITVNFENAGAIDPANPTTGYVLDNAGQFYSFDVETGFYTLLGNIPGDWVGMEFDRTSGILYAISGATLYTIDPVAKTATLVGAMGIPSSDLPIALAIDGNGVGYTYDLVNNLFYSVNLATAATTLIGDIGFDANFGQGMCYDPTTDMVYMSAFNSGTFAAEWRSVNLTTGMTTLVGPIVTTAATTQVAWASIGETLDPPTCPMPTNLVVSNVGSTTVDLAWTAEPNASNGYIWYVFEAGDNPATDSPVATGTTPSGTTSATATGLTGGLAYDFYVVADCDSDGLSQFAGPVTFMTSPACGGKFYDTGGPGGDYSNNENVTTVISPDISGEAVTVTFTAFSTETGWDALYVYDGPDASSPIISSGNPQTNGGFPAGGYYGNSIPGPFTSTHPSGALTFVFRSEGSVTYPGWEADVTCALIGIGENTLEGFSFYPNPTNGMLSLRSTNNIENVAFYNVLGQMVITQRVNATTSQVDVSGLSTGTYLMKVTVNGQTGTYRVLKQ